ncbi:17940_t:CDS:2, partial [Gigaspora rosea]
ENDRNFKGRLQKLKGLFDEGLIIVKEYKEAQSDLLKSFIRIVLGKEKPPLFTIMGGAGIGKSRLLTELPQIARSAVDNDELKKRLNNALVFNISFENGTA